MRRAALLLAVAVRLFGQDTPPAVQPLRPGIPTEVFLAPGRATTVLLRTGEKVSAISLASPVVSYKYDKALNQLELTPTVRSGGVETNLNLRIGDEVYVLLLRIVEDIRAQAVRDFTLEGDPAADDEAGLARARPLAPAEVDIVGAARALDRAEIDPIFRRSQPDLRIEELNRAYSWNGCAVKLVDVAQFVDLDLLVFRVQWVNRTDTALYLDIGQYGLFAGGRPIPIIARYERAPGAIVYPGEAKEVYLGVQGYRVSRHNDWQLGLPPEAAAVERMLSGEGGTP